jgi:outer membrane receptor for ferrienterochelin and colicin
LKSVVAMKRRVLRLDDIVVVDYKVPLIEQDNTTSGQTITSEQIRNLPTKDVTALAAQAAGLSQADEGAAVTVRGSRANATNYYVDGIRVRGAS